MTSKNIYTSGHYNKNNPAYHLEDSGFKWNNFKKLILKIPSNWSENIIITRPANILNVCEFCKSNWPKKEAAAPKIINTKENPNENNIKGIKFISFFASNSFKDAPEIKEI